MPDRSFESRGFCSQYTSPSKDVLNSANTRANPQPFSSNGTTRMCLSLHLKGMCNGCCGRYTDHECHSDQLDEKLKEWANVYYKLPEGSE